MTQSSIHIENSSASALIHNERLFSIDHAIDTDDRNEFFSYENTASKAREARFDYESFHQKKMPSNSKIIKEAIVNLNAEHSLKDLESVKKILEEMGYKVCHIAIHKDEGNIENDGTKIYNFHAHIMLINYDFTKHKTVRPTHKQMRDLQTNVANALKMKRGLEYINTKTAHQEQLAQYIKNPENFTTIKKQRLKTWDYKKAMELKDLEKQEKNKIKERFEIEKKTATDFAKELKIVDESDTKNYTAHSLIPLIKKKFESIRKDYIADGNHSKSDYDALKKERDALIEQIKKSEEHIKTEPEKEQEELETLKTTNENQQEELKKQAEELQKIDKMYGQIVGLIDAGASAEELREVVKMQQAINKIKRPAYINAKTRAQEAYRNRLLKQTKEENETLLKSRNEEQLNNSTRAHRNV